MVGLGATEQVLSDRHRSAGVLATSCPRCGQTVKWKEPKREWALGRSLRGGGPRSALGPKNTPHFGGFQERTVVVQ